MVVSSKTKRLNVFAHLFAENVDLIAFIFYFAYYEYMFISDFLFVSFSFLSDTTSAVLSHCAPDLWRWRTLVKTHFLFISSLNVGRNFKLRVSGDCAAVSRRTTVARWRVLAFSTPPNCTYIDEKPVSPPRFTTLDAQRTNTTRASDRFVSTSKTIQLLLNNYL